MFGSTWGMVGERTRTGELGRSGVIGMVEFKSLIENSNEILGMDIFKEVMKQLGSKNDRLPPAP